MSTEPETRRLAMAVVVGGLVLTCIVALGVVVIGRDTGDDRFVVVPRAELEAAEATTGAGGAGTEAAPYQLVEVERFDSPTAVSPRSGTSDLYVTQLDGKVFLLQPDDSGEPAGYTTVLEPVLDISDQVSAQAGLEGLVGITFSPDGSVLYLGYIDKAHDQVVAAYAVEDGGTSFGPSREILTVNRPDGVDPNNHIGGSVAFGPDGYLYVGVGDGGAGAFRAPDPTSLFGKVLRIVPNPEGGYTIPPDNPLDAARGLPEVWTMGMRNPFRINFDRESGDLWIADVGEEALEEINRLGADDGGGKLINLGWPQYAGSVEYRTDQPSPTDVPPTPPSFEYDHREGRCAVVGGEVYRGTEIPDLVGQYLFSDVCSKALLGLGGAPDGGYEEHTLATTEESQMVSVNADNDGEIFLTSISGGVYRLVAP